MKLPVYCISFFFVLFFILPCVYPQKNVLEAPIDNDGVQKVKILGGNYYFDPDYVVLKVNVPVELTLIKESGITPHNFVIKEPEAGMDIEVSLSEKPRTFLFVPVKTGKFPFHCSKKLLFFKSHREKGMEGIFEVID